MSFFNSLPTLFTLYTNPTLESHQIHQPTFSETLICFTLYYCISSRRYFRQFHFHPLRLNLAIQPHSLHLSLLFFDSITTLSSTEINHLSHSRYSSHFTTSCYCVSFLFLQFIELYTSTTPSTYTLFLSSAASVYLLLLSICCFCGQ